MKFIRKFFHTLIIIAVIVLLSLYWGARTGFAAKRFAEHIESKTGFQTTVGASRLTWGGVVKLENVRIVIPDDAERGVVLYALVAPKIEWNSVFGAKRLRLIRPEIRLVQNKHGAWMPALLKDLQQPGAASLPAALSAIGEKFGGKITVEGAAFYVTNNSDEVLLSCADANFNYNPMRLQGYNSAVHGLFAAQRFAYAGTDITDFKTEWFVLGPRIILLGDNVDGVDRVDKIDYVESIESVDSIDTIDNDDNDPWF